MTDSQPHHEVLAAVFRVAAGYVEEGELDGQWFDLGGSSVDAARLVSWLERELGVSVELKALLTASSVKDCLAVAVAKLSGGQRPGAGGEDPSAGATGTGLTVAAARSATSGVDLLWPSLMQLSTRERIRLAHRLLEDLLQRPDLAG